MASKIAHVIASSSERSRKIIAGITVGLAGMMLFFAWTAGVSARLPVLNAESDGSLQDAMALREQETDATDKTPITSTMSPLRGLVESFQDIALLFQGGAAVETSREVSRTASSSAPRPIDELFDSIESETSRAGFDATSTPAHTTSAVPPSGTGTNVAEVDPVESSPRELYGVDIPGTPENLPPADELPGL